MDDAKFTSIHKNFTSIQQSRFFTRFLWMEVTPLWMEVTPKIPFFEHMALYCCILSNFHQNCCQNSTFQCFLQVGGDGWCQIHFQTLTLPWLPFFVDGRKTLVDRSAWNYNFFKHITWLYTVYCCIRSNCHQNCCQNSTFQCFLQVGGDRFWWVLPYSLLSTQIPLPNINLALASGFCAWK